MKHARSAADVCRPHTAASERGRCISTPANLPRRSTLGDDETRKHLWADMLARVSHEFLPIYIYAAKVFRKRKKNKQRKKAWP